MNDPLGLGEPEPGDRHTCWFRRILRNREDAKEWIGDEPPSDVLLAQLWAEVHGGRWIYKDLASRLFGKGLVDVAEWQIGSCARMECKKCQRTGAPDLVADG